MRRLWADMNSDESEGDSKSLPRRHDDASYKGAPLAEVNDSQQGLMGKMKRTNMNETKQKSGPSNFAKLFKEELTTGTNSSASTGQTASMKRTRKTAKMSPDKSTTGPLSSPENSASKDSDVKKRLTTGSDDFKPQLKPFMDRMDAEDQQRIDSFLSGKSASSFPVAAEDPLKSNLDKQTGDSLNSDLNKVATSTAKISKATITIKAAAKNASANVSALSSTNSPDRPNKKITTTMKSSGKQPKTEDSGSAKKPRGSGGTVAALPQAVQRNSPNLATGASPNLLTNSSSAIVPAESSPNLPCGDSPNLANADSPNLPANDSPNLPPPSGNPKRAQPSSVNPKSVASSVTLGNVSRFFGPTSHMPPVVVFNPHRKEVVSADQISIGRSITNTPGSCLTPAQSTVGVSAQESKIQLIEQLNAANKAQGIAGGFQVPAGKPLITHMTGTPQWPGQQLLGAQQQASSGTQPSGSDQPILHQILEKQNQIFQNQSQIRQAGMVPNQQLGMAPIAGGSIPPPICKGNGIPPPMDKGTLPSKGKDSGWIDPNQGWNWNDPSWWNNQWGGQRGKRMRPAHSQNGDTESLVSEKAPRKKTKTMEKANSRLETWKAGKNGEVGGSESLDTEKTRNERLAMLDGERERAFYKHFITTKERNRSENPSENMDEIPRTPTKFLGASRRCWKFEYERWRRSVREYVIKNNPDIDFSNGAEGLKLRGAKGAASFSSGAASSSSSSACSGKVSADVDGKSAPAETAGVGASSGKVDGKSVLAETAGVGADTIAKDD